MNDPVDTQFSDQPRPRSRLALVALYCVLVPVGVCIVGSGVGVGLIGFYLALVGLPLGLVLGLVVLVRNAVSPGRTGSGLAVLAVLISGGIMGFGYWFFSNMAGGFHGRVLRIRGRAVLTPVRRLDRPAVIVDLPALGGLAGSDRAALTAHWTLAAREEHTSIAAFERLALALQARGASRSLIEGAHGAAQQEADHAARCFALASAFAGHTLVPGPLAIADAPTPTLSTLAVEALVDGCVGEGTGAREAQMLAAEGLTHPSLQATFAVIARDEAEHEALSWDVLTWCLSVGGEPVRAAVVQALARLDRQGTPPTGTTRSAAQRAHGMATVAEREQAWRGALANTHARAQALLAATDSVAA